MLFSALLWNAVFEYDSVWFIFVFVPLSLVGFHPIQSTAVSCVTCMKTSVQVADMDLMSPNGITLFIFMKSPDNQSPLILPNLHFSILLLIFPKLPNFSFFFLWAWKMLHSDQPTIQLFHETFCYYNCTYHYIIIITYVWLHYIFIILFWTFSIGCLICCWHTTQYCRTVALLTEQTCKWLYPNIFWLSTV